MGGPPNVARILVVALLASAAFVIGLLVLIQRTVASKRAEAMADVAAEVRQHESRGTSLLDAAAGVAGPFVQGVGAGDFGQAYPLLAAPFREAVSPESFARACRASPILARARAVTLNRLRQQSGGGGATTWEASGVLDSAAGAVPIGFVFLQEGEALRILVVSLAGVPVLQGVAR
jgi:hypothetical protein